MEETEILRAAASHALLGSLDPSILQAVLRASKLVQYRGKRPVIREGDPSSQVFCLLAGSVRVFHRREEAEILVKLFRAPAIFGETEVLAGIPFMLNATTLERCDILHVPAPSFRELVRTQAKFAQLLALDLSRSLCVASAHQRALVFNDIEKRLANLLLDYADLAGRPVEGGVRLEIALSQDGMAKDLGVSRKAVTLTLLRFKDEGLIDKVDARYVVRDSAALAARSAATPGLVHQLMPAAKV